MTSSKKRKSIVSVTDTFHEPPKKIKKNKKRKAIDSKSDTFSEPPKKRNTSKKRKKRAEVRGSPVASAPEEEDAGSSSADDGEVQEEPMELKGEVKANGGGGDTELVSGSYLTQTSLCLVFGPIIFLPCCNYGWSISANRTVSQLIKSS